MVLTPTTSIRLAATRLCPGRLARGLASTAAGSSHPHLVVLLHGLHGEPSDMAFLHRRLLQGGHGRLHVLSAATAGDQTDGIDAAGPRVTREIEAACDAIGPRACSLSWRQRLALYRGALLQRRARWPVGAGRAGLLEPATEARGLLERWRPQLFSSRSLASPHLGVFPFGLFWSERLVRRVASLGYFGIGGWRGGQADALAEIANLAVRHTSSALTPPLMLSRREIISRKGSQNTNIGIRVPYLYGWYISSKQISNSQYFTCVPATAQRTEPAVKFSTARESAIRSVSCTHMNCIVVVVSSQSLKLSEMG